VPARSTLIGNDMKQFLWFASFALAGVLSHALAFGQLQPQEVAAEPSLPRNASHDVWGTGFFVDRRGNILTAHHVVTDCREIAIVGNGSREPAAIVASSTTDDLSLLRVARPFGEPLAFDSRDDLPGGTLITILGYGILTELRPDDASHPGLLANGMVVNLAVPRQIAFVSNAKPGGSGSPVIGRDGLVVGVLAHKLTRNGALIPDGRPREVRIAVSSRAAQEFLRDQNVAPLEGRAMLHLPTDLVDVLFDAEVKVECHR
jgi:S1-C subfamily serine protease